MSENPCENWEGKQCGVLLSVKPILEEMGVSFDCPFDEPFDCYFFDFKEALRKQEMM